MKSIKTPIVIIGMLVLVYSCSSNKQGKEYLNDWKFTENIDKAKIVKTDVETGKMFDILTSKTTGITFNNELIETFDLNYYRYGYSYNGAGVGVGDFNNDGLQDLYFSGNVVPDRIYINKGNMQFEDITAKSGINQKPGWSTGVTVVDVNEDGFKDIYVCRARFEDPVKRRNLLYINNGDLTFTEKGEEFGLADDSYSTQANFFDADNDGDLDVYIVTHPTDFKDKNKQKNFQKIEDGSNMSNRFYRNEGNGKFTECHKEVGINNHGFGLSVTTGDINNDGWMDVFVGNDYIMHDYTYINQGDGTFKEMSREVLNKTAYYGMGTDIADYNNDGLLDMFTVDMDIEGNYGTKTFMQSNKQTFLRTLVNGGYLQQYGRNALQLNNGVGKFSEVANFAGVSTTGWSWSPLFADYDNDGNKDLYVSNGFLKDSHMDIMEVYIKLTRANRLSDSSEYYELRKQIPENSVLEWPNAMFHNNGDLTFEDVREDWGLYFPSTSYGAAYADLDNDGDVDIVVNNANLESYIARNNSSKLTTNKYLRVDLQGEKSNPDGLGTKIYVTTGNKTQLVQMETVKGYQSCSEPVAHFGLGTAEKVDKVVVVWLDGKENVATEVTTNQTLVFAHKDAIKPAKTNVPMQDKLFVDATKDLQIDFVHKENEFDDFDREFLIPHELSNLGPGLAVGDINGDGMEDFFVGGAKNQSGAVYLQAANGTFTKGTFAAGVEDIQSEDQGAIFFDADGDSDLDLYVVSGGSDFPKDDGHLMDRLYINDGKGNFNIASGALPQMISSGSIAAAQDYDKDGDMDLFIGGRMIPGNYPYPTGSYILQNNKGKFTDVTKAVAPDLMEIGMVSAGLWTDYNNDGDYDLIITGEWMPITVFENNGGKFKNITSSTGLSESTGWWNSLTAGDFDNDGDMDYVAGNFGINLKYRPKEKPIELFYDDYDDNGTHDIIMGYWQHDKLYPQKTRERMIEQMKGVEEIFPDWDSYGRAEVWDFYGKKRMENSKLHYKANSFYTSYIENLGNNKFQVKKLPNEAQISTTFGIVAMDVNNDGFLDIVSHGNFYETEIETNTQDAGIGNVLLGNGDGSFTPLPARNSGFYSCMNAKALALICVGTNKTPVLITSNNNNKMEAFKLVSNEKSIALNNNDAYVIITYTDGKKRRQELYTGSGYLSQNSKSVIINSQVAEVTVYDNKGTARSVYGGVTALSAKH
ncbi:MAG: VCBS repeat-containing protein [Bacteroidetes bacterium]|nr:VCBS repeat-containing protein [Bacteroidota bacterium]